MKFREDIKLQKFLLELERDSIKDAKILENKLI